MILVETNEDFQNRWCRESMAFVFSILYSSFEGQLNAAAARLADPEEQWISSRKFSMTAKIIFRRRLKQIFCQNFQNLSHQNNFAVACSFQSEHNCRLKIYWGPWISILFADVAVYADVAHIELLAHNQLSPSTHVAGQSSLDTHNQSYGLKCNRKSRVPK